MREKVRRLSKGIFEYELPGLLQSAEEILFEVEADQTYEGEFTIANEASRPMKGLIYCDCARITIKNPVFDATQHTIYYDFCATDLKPQETIKTSFIIVSDIGEFKVPITATVLAPYIETSIGNIRDLFHFANLAATSWNEAVRIFHLPEFEKIILKKDEKNRILYRGFMESASVNHALEEFLVSIRKKMKVVLNVKETLKNYQGVYKEVLDGVILHRSNWGYTEVEVTSDAAFIVPEVQKVISEQFIRDEYQVKYSIRPEYLKAGKQEGNLIFTTHYQQLKVHVIVENEMKEDGLKELKVRRLEKEMTLRYMHHFLDFRMGRLAKEEYEKRMEYPVRTLLDNRKNSIGGYLKIHLELVAGRSQTAARLLMNYDHKFSSTVYGVFPKEGRTEPVNGKQEVDLEEYCTYVYLKALFLKKDEVTEEAVQILREFYEKDQSSPKILWFLLYLDKRYLHHPRTAIDEMMVHLHAGYASPVFYFEILKRLENIPESIPELTDEYISVFAYGAKTGYLSEAVKRRFVFLAGRLKQYHPLVFLSLKRLYMQTPSDEILTVMIKLLIRGNVTQHSSFQWYQLGVLKKLDITELQTYYLYSMDWSRGDEIDDSVIAYFSYQKEIPEKIKGKLYSYIVRKSMEYPENYKKYYTRMKSYAMEQLERGNVSSDMAVLFEELLGPEDFQMNHIRNLQKYVFLYEFSTNDPEITSVCVRHKELEKEEIYPLSCNGKDGRKYAYISLYTENAVIFLCDLAKNRYVDTKEYTLNQMFHFEEYVARMAAAGKENAGMLCYLFEKEEVYHQTSVDAQQVCEKMLKLPELNRQTRTKCTMKLMRSYYEQFATELLDDLLRKVDLSEYSMGERKVILEYLMIRDMLAPAYEGIRRYGQEGLNPKRVMRLCTKLIEQNLSGKEIPGMTGIAYRAFLEVRCDAPVLRYLERFFEGSTEQYLRLWEKLTEESIPTEHIENRLLAQALYAETSLSAVFPVFLSYQKHGREKIIIRGFLSYCSYKYLLRDIVLPDECFTCLQEEILREPSDVMVLAFLKYMSKAEKLTKEQEMLVEYQLGIMIDKKMILPFFKDFKGKVAISSKIYNKYYVEYRTNPNNHVMLHYCILGDEEQHDGYHSVPMRNVFEGIFVADFLLFYNDELQYYITEEGKGGDRITESFHIKMDSLYEEEENQYNMLNLMLTARQMRDEKTLIELMEQYIQTEYATKLFRPLKE